MGNRSKCQSPGAFGSKYQTQITAPDGTVHICGVVRPNRGRALWKNQKMRVRKGFKARRQGEIFKQAKKQTAAAKELEQKIKKTPFSFIRSLVRRKAPVAP